VTRTLRVLVADDDARLREDLCRLLDLEPDITVVGAAADGTEAVRAAERTRPDVVVMDVRMPLLDGIEATRLLRRRVGEGCRVLVMTTFDLDEYVVGAARAGAAGFLLKDRAAEDLAGAVRIVASGQGVVSPRATARLLHHFAGSVPAADPPLTPRELDLVRLLARGLSKPRWPPPPTSPAPR
jgi:DNA-binding NarL/FixJ family response regulator